MTLGGLEMKMPGGLGLRLGLWQSNGAGSLFPLTALLKQLDTLKSLEHRTLSTGSARCLE